MAVTQAPRIAVVIVTYNSAGVLAGCLRSLAVQEGVEVTAIVIADNASSDETLRIAQDHDHLPVRAVQLGRNAGYAAGINAGTDALDLTDLDAVFVMNPDCRLGPDTLRLLARALSQPRLGISVPRLHNPDGTLHHSLRRAPTVRGAFAEAIMGGRRAGRLGRSGEMITDPGTYERAGAATWATGAAMLIAVDALREIGPWDESFFLYSEETEFALRAADKGWTLWFEPAAVVEHIGGDAKTNPSLAALLMVNKVRLFRRRHGAGASVAYYVAIVFGQTIRALAGERTARWAVAALLKPARRDAAARRDPAPEGVGLGR